MSFGKNGVKRKTTFKMDTRSREIESDDIRKAFHDHVGSSGCVPLSLTVVESNPYKSYIVFGVEYLEPKVSESVLGTKMSSDPLPLKTFTVVLEPGHYTGRDIERALLEQAGEAKVLLIKVTSLGDGKRLIVEYIDTQTHQNYKLKSGEATLDQTRYLLEDMSSFFEKKKKAGRIEVICGPMFAGKSSELFRRLKRHHMAGCNVLLIKSAKDDRYGTDETVSASHDGQLFPAQAVNEITEAKTTDVDVIGVDEGQFMGPELTRWSTRMASNCGKIVIVACLDTNFMMEPWENIMPLLCVTERNTKLAAICCVCGEDAHFSRKTKESKNLIEVGGQDLYVPTCRGCHSAPMENTHEYMRRVDSLKKLNQSFDSTK